MKEIDSLSKLEELHSSKDYLFVVKVGGLEDWEICNDLEVLSQQPLRLITPILKEHEDIAKAFTDNPKVGIKFNCGGSWMYFDETKDSFIDTYCDVWRYEIIKYPESEKLLKNQSLVRNISEYIEFLSVENVLSLKNGEGYLYKMLDVDSVKLESERRDMLSNIG